MQDSSNVTPGATSMTPDVPEHGETGGEGNGEVYFGHPTAEMDPYQGEPRQQILIDIKLVCCRITLPLTYVLNKNHTPAVF